MLFGYDSADPISAHYDAVVAAFGAVDFVARYTEQLPGLSAGLTPAEVSDAHARGAALLLCYNGAQPGDVSQGYAAGLANAGVATRHARALGAPARVGIWVDIETSWYLTAPFLAGWRDGVHAAGYTPCAYLNANNAQHVGAAYAAGGILIWSSEPEWNAWRGTRKTDWYQFSADSVASIIAARVVCHQYSENELGNTVDLNCALPDLEQYLWGPNPPAPPAPRHARIAHTCALKPSPDHTSPSIHTCYGGDVVTLLDSGANGWTHVEALAKGHDLPGYVLSSNLIPM